MAEDRPYNEADTRAKLIDPMLHQRGWNEDMIKREETPGAIEVIEGKPRKRAKGHIDYTVRVRVQTSYTKAALWKPNPSNRAQKQKIKNHTIYGEYYPIEIFRIFRRICKLGR